MWHRPVVTLAILVLVPGCLDVHGNAWASSATQLADIDAQGWRPVRIAILDTGIDTTHPALAHLADRDPRNGEVVSRKDFAGNEARLDGVGHGTFVASLLAAQPPGGFASVSQSESRLRGLLPAVALLDARVCVGERCLIRQIDDAINWAVNQQADIIVMSLGFGSAEVQLHQDTLGSIRSALASAERRGVVVVAAAGNSGDEGTLFPASEPTVLAVGAVNRRLEVRASSARDEADERKPDLVAPGEGIVGAWLNHELVALDGTSAAAPFVVAAAAVIVAHDSGVSSDAQRASLVRNALLATAQPVWQDNGQPARGSGQGLVQASDALRVFLAL